jgi:hypothetical protein
MSKNNMDKTNETRKNSKTSNLEKRGKEALREIKARNRYFYIYNRYGLIFGTLLSFMLIVNLLILIFFQNQTVPPVFVPVDSEMRYFPPSPLKLHNKSDSDIQTFTMTSIKDLLSYDYINYNEQLLKHQEKFTSHGWKLFIENMKKSFILDIAQENKWISSFRNTNLPRIVKKAIDEDGKAYWLVELDGVNSFIGERSRNDNVTIRLKIKRESTLIKESGIGIDSFLYINNNDNRI